MLKIATIAFLSLSVFSAHARLQLIPDVASTNAGDKEDYRLGDEWGKKRVTDETLKTESKAFQRAASATAFPFSIAAVTSFSAKSARTSILFSSFLDLKRLKV